MSGTLISFSGYEEAQKFFASVNAPSIPPKPALILLLMSMVNEKQPFALRCAVLYSLQSFLHKHPGGQREIMETLLPQSQQAQPQQTNEVTAGQLLCGGKACVTRFCQCVTFLGLFSGDRLSNWLSSVALAHGLADNASIKVVEFLTTWLNF